MIAEQLGKTLNDEAVDGWEYVRAETLTTPGQRGLLKQPVPAAYVVLIFKRARETVWQANKGPADNAQTMSASQSVSDPKPAPVTHAKPMAAPVHPQPNATPVMTASDGTTPVQHDVPFASTSVQLVSIGDGLTQTRPPLGSAQD